MPFIQLSSPNLQTPTPNLYNLNQVPTGLTVSCHEQRDLTTNRSIARKLLKDKLDLLLHGEESKLGKRVVRIQKRKSKSASRARKKYETKGSGDELDTTV